MINAVKIARHEPDALQTSSEVCLNAPTVELIGAAMGLGGPDTGAAGGPAVLHRLGLANVLRSAGHLVRWSPVLLPEVAHAVGGQSQSRLAAVHDFNLRLAKRVETAVLANRFPLVLGGDHSIAAGTWAGAARALSSSGRAPPGLLWIDAHMDAHTPSTTPTGNPHGMPLAELLGAYGTGPSLNPQHVALVGVRSYEHAEAGLLERLGVRVYFADEVARRGLQTVISEALARVSQAGAYGVTLDIDALDPIDAPATSTREPGGLRADALIAALAQLKQYSGLMAAEIVEYNPFLDADRGTARLVERLTHILIAGVRR